MGWKKKDSTAVDVLDLIGGNAVVIEKNKIIRMLEGNEKILNWIKTKNDVEKEVIPRFTSAINIDYNKSYEKNKNAIFTMIMDMGIVESNNTRVAILPSRTNANWSIMDITIDNYEKAVSAFTARKLITPNWYNWQDEYRVPNETHPLYKQWVNDSVVYSYSIQSLTKVH